MATDDPINGVVLAARYKLGPLLGRGGMADVRRARDLRIGRWVAVKLLRPELVRDPSFEGRFRREAQSAASLHSPGIVAVYDTGETPINGAVTPYIVMELVEGRTLRDVLALDGRMPPLQAITITSAICAALDEAHRAGIVHRDVKPANVMLTNDNEVKVMDFGIARATSSAITMTQTATVVGTAHYLSPEQARGEHVDARSDVYSTGCVLYELLTGSPPFTGETAVAVAYQHVREAPVPPSRLVGDLPAGLEAVVLKALAKNPASRYQSAGELRDDLERVREGRPVSAAASSSAAAANIPPAPPATSVLLREPPRHRVGKSIVYTLLAAATVAVFVVALLVARSVLAGAGGDIETPDVVGQSLQDAQATLNQAGLRVAPKPAQQYSNKPVGDVLSQVPLHPILLNPGGSVILTISRGIHEVTVPEILGDQVAQAKVDLTNAGFVVGTVKNVPSRKPNGQVLDSEPASGETKPIGTTVNLVVSNATVTVPGVVGMGAQTAELTLRRDGFPVIERSSTTYHPSVPIGRVVAQLPEAGTFATVNSTVQIFLNEKPPPPAKSSPPVSSSSTPPAGKSSPPATTSSPPATTSSPPAGKSPPTH